MVFIGTLGHSDTAHEYFLRVDAEVVSGDEDLIQVEGCLSAKLSG